MTGATDKQTAFIATLKTTAILDRNPNGRGQNEARQMLAECALILALPAPTSAQDASAQIDGLKGSMMSYAKGNKAWAQPVMTALGTALGTGTPVVPTAQSATEWDAYVRATVA